MNILLLGKLLLVAIVTMSLQAFSADEEISNMKAEFAAMKLDQEIQFETYDQELKREFAAYKEELEEYWTDPKLSSKENWLSYSKDKQTRSDVDFEKNVIKIEVIATSPLEASKKIERQMAYVVSKDTKQVVQTDPLQKRIAKIKKSNDVITSVVDKKPILSNIIFDKVPTKKELKNYTEKTLAKSKITKKKSKIKNKHVYKVSIPLPTNTQLKRAAVYKEDIFTNAEKFNVPAELIFAVMHTESYFNPFAKSHIPAYGLMQIVPTSAGRDTYFFLYKEKGTPSSHYLYNAKNNIEMGSSYLHILYYRYLRKIKDPQSRLYCTIAAYNTGAGNIAWAYTRNNNISRAAPLINAMHPNDVYNHLLQNLKYDEPKHYLKNVSKRMKSYKKAYKL